METKEEGKTVEELTEEQKVKLDEFKKKLKIFYEHKDAGNKKRRRGRSHCPCAICREVRRAQGLPSKEFFQSSDGKKYTTNADGMLLRIK